MNELTIDQKMLERMADSFSMMSDGEKANWTMRAAEEWVQDEAMYAWQKSVEPLPYDVEDVYDTIKAMIQAEE